MPNDDAHENNTLHEPHPKLQELTERLSGKWRVEGHEIAGAAEYRPAKDGFLLVQDVDFVVSGTKMKVMQHISYDQATDTLQARYMDTMGDESTYIWALDGRTMRVSHDDKDSDTYYEATFNDDYSEYSGKWHYPYGDDPEEEPIVYKRIRNNE